jgi:hypothetical protein
MPLFGISRRAEDGDVMGSFILNEIRDLRKGMEGRDSELRAEMLSIRDAVATLSESLSSSQVNARAIRQDVDKVMADQKAIRTDVDAIRTATSIQAVKSESAWSGPKDIFRNLALIGGGAGGVIALVKLFQFMQVLPVPLMQ